jgi:hypothetical protein
VSDSVDTVAAALGCTVALAAERTSGAQEGQVPYSKIPIPKYPAQIRRAASAVDITSELMDFLKAKAVVSQAIPVEVQIQLIANEVVDAYRSGNAAAVLTGVMKYRALGKKPPPALLFAEGKAASQRNHPWQSAAALEEYFAVVGAEDPMFTDAVKLYGQVSRRLQTPSSRATKQ